MAATGPLPYPGYDELKTLFTELVRQAIEGYETSVVVPGELMEMRSMLANLGETWKKRWLAEGEAGDSYFSPNVIA